MNIGRIMTRAGEQYGNRPAFIWADQVISYGEADARSSSLAIGLRNLAIRPGDRVGVFMRNCPHLLESFFAIWKAGGCVVPLNARFVCDEVAYHLQDSEASCVIFSEEFREIFLELRPHLPSVKLFICDGDPAPDQHAYEEIVTSCRGGDFVADRSQDDLAWLFYTSGTTGRPKGAMLSHGNLTFMAVGMIADLVHLEPEDVGLHAAPLTHAAGFLSLAMVMKAAAQVILKPDRFDPETFCATVARNRVTSTWLVPTQIKLLLRYPGLGRWDLSSLTRVVYGGAHMYVADLKEALRRFGPIFVQLYGLGESPMTGTYLRPQEHEAEGPAVGLLASCGCARSGVEVRILNPDGQELPRREMGEICVRGPSVMKGYWRRPEETAQTMRGGWLHTGDLGQMDEQGYVYILDRNKDMIISGGANVYPREVEEILLQHPAVQEACVIGVPDDLWGEAVKAIIVLKHGQPECAEEIISFATRKMAGYKKPKSVEFVDELPKSSIGKVLKRELRDRYWKGCDRRI